MGLVASQCLWAFYPELPNHLILTPVQDATQSVHMCHSPNAHGLSISSGEGHFGIDELLDYRLSCNSECVLCQFLEFI